MQVESIDFNEFKPIIYDIVKELLEEERNKQKELKVPVISNFELYERVVKIEEELRHQRELIKIILEQMDKRFEQIDKRFEQIDKRFEQIDKRFEQVNKRFEQIDKRFEQVNKRFEQIDKRFEQIDKRFQQVDKRFELVEKRFEQIDKKFEQITMRLDRFMFWFLGLVVSATLTIIGYMHYFIK